MVLKCPYIPKIICEHGSHINMKLLVWASLVVCALANGQFKSRPDLSVPVWNTSAEYSARKNELSPGYYFVSPYSASTQFINQSVEQPGAYIYTQDGELVWSSFSAFGGISFNFQAAYIEGKPVLYAFEGQFSAIGGHGYGHIKILDDHYISVKDIRAGNHKFIDIHEFQLASANGTQTGLIESYSPIASDLSKYNYGDTNRKWIISTVVQELELETNRLLFEWSALDHISPDDSKVSLFSGEAGDGLSATTAWDYFHVNSIDKNQQGDYIISARHTSSLYKIDGKTGEIIWRFSTSNPSDLKIVGKQFTFGFQHHARFLETDGDIEIISFFDNNGFSAGHTEPGNDGPEHASSGKVIEVDNQHKTVKLVKQYDPPVEHQYNAKSQGSFVTLPNGNKLINWGSAGALTEYNKEGEILFDAKLDSGIRGADVQNYRAFKSNWTGKSSEDIAVAHEDGHVFISWNGDTVTKNWEIVEESTGRTLASVKKSGFETVANVTSNGTFYVNALNSEGYVIKSTKKKSPRSALKLIEKTRDYFKWKQNVLTT